MSSSLFPVRNGVINGRGLFCLHPTRLTPPGKKLKLAVVSEMKETDDLSPCNVDVPTDLLWEWRVSVKSSRHTYREAMAEMMRLYIAENKRKAEEKN